jgi:hypothetical protein
VIGDPCVAPVDHGDQREHGSRRNHDGQAVACSCCDTRSNSGPQCKQNGDIDDDRANSNHQHNQKSREREHHKIRFGRVEKAPVQAGDGGGASTQPNRKT